MYKCVQNCSTAKCRCNSGRDAGDWDPSEGKTLQTRDRTDTKLQASSLHLPSIKHVKRAKTAQLRASAHDYLKKTPRLGSQSILPSTSFALAQQASSREHSKAFTKDDDDTTSLSQWKMLSHPKMTSVRIRCNKSRAC